MTNTRRNDPCPCGSGKKYKKCCLRSVEENEFEYRRQRQVEAGLIPRLLDYAFETLGPDSLADAWEEFNDYEPVEDFDPESPMNIVFMPWYIFNCEFEAPDTPFFETTIAESFLEKHEKSLTADEETFLRSAIRCPYSLCEVIEVKPGVGMKLLDLFRRDENEVVERLASQSLKRGDIIYCATTEVGKIRSNISTSPFALRPIAKRDVLELRKEIVAEVGYQPLTALDLYEFEADIRGLYLDLLAQMFLPPELVNTDREPLLPQKLYFALQSVHEAFHALKDLAEGADENDLLEGAKIENGRVISAEIPWSGGNLEATKPLGGPVLLGLLKLDASRLIVEVNSTERAELIRNVIEERLGDRVTYKTTLIEPMEQTIADAREKAGIGAEDNSPHSRARAASAGEGVGVSSDSYAPLSSAFHPDVDESLEIEASLEVFEMMKEAAQQHWDLWYDIPVPALDKMTPREAAKTSEGRDLLESLLLYYQRENDNSPDNPFKADIPAIRRKLRLKKKSH
jgi:hypothetical protein